MRERAEAVVRFTGAGRVIAAPPGMHTEFEALSGASGVQSADRSGLGARGRRSGGAGRAGVRRSHRAQNEAGAARAFRRVARGIGGVTLMALALPFAYEMEPVAAMLLFGAFVGRRSHKRKQKKHFSLVFKKVPYFWRWRNRI